MVKIACIIAVFFASYVSASESSIDASKTNMYDTSNIIHFAVSEAPPMTSKELPDGGFLPKVFSKALALEGYSATYDFFPSKRALTLAIKGDYEAFAVGVKSKLLDKYFYYSMPIGKIRLVIFHLKEKPFHWKTHKDFKGLTIATFYNTKALGKEFIEAADKHKFHITQETSFETGLKQLLSGKVDLYITYKAMGLHAINTTLPKDQRLKITQHPKPLTFANNYVLFHKREGAQRKVDIFNSGMRKIIQTGEYKAMLEEAFPFVVKDNYTSKAMEDMK